MLCKNPLYGSGLSGTDHDDDAMFSLPTLQNHKYDKKGNKSNDDTNK